MFQSDIDNRKMIKHIIGSPLFYLLNRFDLRYSFMRNHLGETIEQSRNNSLKLMGAAIGNGSYVRKDCFITNPSFLTIGDRSKIGIRSELYLYTNFSVGNDVEIGSGLIVHTSEHTIDDKNKPLAKQGAKYKPVTIEDDVYIGSRVTILSGVTVHSRVVIAAGAVVTKDLESGSIYGGVPATPIRKI